MGKSEPPLAILLDRVVEHIFDPLDAKVGERTDRSWDILHLVGRSADLTLSRPVFELPVGKGVRPRPSSEHD